jgi:phage/plasmid-associated DNA primase
MWLLVHYLKKYKRGGMQDPESVRIASLEYKKKSDMYLQFMDENFVTTNNDADRLTIQDMYDAFKFWWRNMNTTPVPSKTDFMEYLNANTKLKRIGKTTIVGLKCTRTEEI